jgi:hypothetical protein
VATGLARDPNVPRAKAGTVERGKNPEDGTDGGLATSVRRRDLRVVPAKKGHPT